MVEEIPEGEASFTQTDKVGDVLRAAREKQGSTIEDIATETRVPLRHLRALDSNDYAALPGKTYAMGFARAYARAVGLDEVDISRQLRSEIDAEAFATTPRYEVYAPADPARVPPKWLAWTAGFLALAVLLGALLMWRMNNQVPVEAAPIEQETAEAATSETAAAPSAANPALPAVADDDEVAITAKDTVWFRIDDASGKRVHEAELKAGDRYVLPAGSKGMTLRTSRPQAMDVSVAGRVVPTLGPADTLVKNVSLDAASLAARGAAPASATPPSVFVPPPTTTPAPAGNL